MKIFFVVDSINDITKKVETIKRHFDSEIFFVVKSQLSKIFATYGYSANAVYTNHLASVLHELNLKTEKTDTLVYYSSLDIDNKLISKFIEKINDKSKLVNVMPNYNIFERLYNKMYNVYVKSLFKTTDCLATPKLQFIPERFADELVNSHFGNRLFEANPTHLSVLYLDKEQSKTSKIKKRFNTNYIIPIIVALLITISLITIGVLTKTSYAFWIIFIFLYLLDAMITLIFGFKSNFDNRFLK